MREALQKGRLGISALSPRVTTGKEQWQEWHHDFFHNQMQARFQPTSCRSTTAHPDRGKGQDMSVCPDASGNSELRPSARVVLRGCNAECWTF